MVEENKMQACKITLTTSVDGKETEIIRKGSVFLSLSRSLVRYVEESAEFTLIFEKDGVKYHHILDPRTAAPAKSDLSSVTVVCASAPRADALAPALYIMGLEKGLSFVNQKEDIEALFVTKQGEIKLSNGLQERFTPNK